MPNVVVIAIGSARPENIDLPFQVLLAFPSLLKFFLDGHALFCPDPPHRFRPRAFPYLRA
jgi:hypothetical protein